MCRLKQLRRSLKLSQKDVANKLGITQQAYANYENGKRDVASDMLIKLSSIFSCSIDYILENTDQIEIYEELDPIYFRLAKETQNQKIHPDDIRKIIDIIKSNR